MASGDATGYIYENVGYIPNLPTGEAVGYIYLGDVLTGLTHVGWGIPA